MKTKFLSILLFMVFSTNSFGFVDIRKSILIDLSSLNGTESAEDFVGYLKSNLQTEFSKSNTNFTYLFLERYMQIYSNESKNIFGKEVILSASYDRRKDLTNAQLNFHYYDKNGKIDSAKVTVGFKISKESNPDSLTFGFKNNYNGFTKQLINLYLSASAKGERLIFDSSETKLTAIDSKTIKVDVHYRVYGNVIKDSAIEREISLVTDVSKKAISFFRR